MQGTANNSIAVHPYGIFRIRHYNRQGIGPRAIGKPWTGFLPHPFPEPQVLLNEVIAKKALRGIIGYSSEIPWLWSHRGDGFR